MIVDRYYVWLI